MRVFVVEDEAPLRSYLVPLLEREGFDVEAFGTGSEALASICDRRPDLVLLDVGLPDVSGLDVCREIRRLPEYVPRRSTATSLRPVRGGRSSGRLGG